MRTLIVMLMDESGSMEVRKSDVISGFNEFLVSQQAITADSASVVFVKFNTCVQVIHECLPVGQVPALTNASFTPDGMTALFDAIGEGVRLGEKLDSEFDRVLCIILTDGEDNASRRTSSEGVRRLLKAKETEGKWTFLYIGENPEKWADETGIDAGNAAPYNHANQRLNYVRLCEATSGYRMAVTVQQQGLLQAQGLASVEPTVEVEVEHQRLGE